MHQARPIAGRDTAEEFDADPLHTPTPFWWKNRVACGAIHPPERRWAGRLLQSPAVTRDERAVEDRAVEVLGGTPDDVRRPPVTPAVRLVPPYVADRIRRFDELGDAFFERYRGGAVADRVMYGASALGDFSLLWHLVGLGRAVARPETEREALRLTIALGIESVLINGVVKSGFRRTRPVREEHAVRKLRRPRSSSFPSGHATSGFMAATLLAQGRPRQRLLWYALAAVVASSRVHVRIHHPTDVAAGAVIGVALGRVARRFGA